MSSRIGSHHGDLFITTQTATVERYRRPRGQHPRPWTDAGEKPTKTLPEYVEHHEVETLIRATQNPKARLLFMIEWRAGLRVLEALAIEARDLLLEGELPSLSIRRGKGARARIVPAHPELQNALNGTLQFSDVGAEDRLVSATRSTADRWIKMAAARAEEVGSIPPGRRISNHTLRHSYARHLLAHGRPINFVSR